MKKILFTLAATLTSIWAMSQFYVCKDGAVVYKIDDGVADSITFTEPNFSKVTDVYHDGTENGYNYVDLGLPSGTLWATCNVGAQSPSEYGDYFAWGEVEPKENYSWNTYKYGSDSDQLTKYCNKSDNGKEGYVDMKKVLDMEDDVAHVNFGGQWTIPTKTQQEELRSECYWVLTDSYNGSNVKGYIVYKAKSSSVKGKIGCGELISSEYSLSDAHIFLPNAGYYYEDNFITYSGGYWSSSLAADPSDAWSVVLSSSCEIGVSYGGILGRSCGYSVRPVIPGE